MANKKSSMLSDRVATILPFIVIFGLVLFAVGIGFLCSKSANGEKYLWCISKPVLEERDSHVFDYTNCINYDKEKTCIDILSKNPFEACYCTVPINLTVDLTGEVVMSYELDFNQSSVVREGNYTSSRDDNQLMGLLSDQPSNACEPYAYDITPDGVRRPIAPCGAIADAMFNDTIELITGNSSDIVRILRTSLLSEKYKQGYHNPELPGNMSLTLAFHKFSKPKNWVKNIWELSDTNENNGFENEAFIAWMNTDLARKPVWRVNTLIPGYEDGLKKGSYGLYVGYNYPLSRYNGSRRAVLSRRVNVTREVCDYVPYEHSNSFVIGLVALIIGIIFLVLAVAAFIAHRRKVNEFERVNLTTTPTETTAEPESMLTLRLTNDDDIRHIDDDENPFKHL